MANGISAEIKYGEILMDAILILNQKIQEVLKKHDLIIASFNKDSESWVGQTELFFRFTPASSPIGSPRECYRRLDSTTSVVFSLGDLLEIPKQISLDNRNFELQATLTAVSAAQNQIAYNLSIDGSRYRLHIPEHSMHQACAGFHFSPCAGDSAFCYYEIRYNPKDLVSVPRHTVVDLYLTDEQENCTLYHAQIPLSLTQALKHNFLTAEPVYSVMYGGMCSSVYRY